MPLDEVARRYADNLFREVEEKVLRKQNEDLIQLQADQSRRGMLASGGHILAQVRLILTSIEEIGRAKAKGLIQAYEKSGIPFDEQICQQVKAEVMTFCHSEQHKAVNFIVERINKLFPGGNSPQFQDAFVRPLWDGVTNVLNRVNRDLEIRRDEIILEDTRLRKAYAAGLGKQWDVFICHASEDKATFVNDLARALRESGLSVWYDEFTLTVGDSLRGKIDLGLAASRFGVVVLSPHFFVKPWTQNELDGLMSKEIVGTKVILPVWHNISKEQVQNHSPILAGRLAAKSIDGVREVVKQLRQAMGL